MCIAKRFSLMVFLTCCVALASAPVLANAASAQTPTPVSPEIARKLNEIITHAALDGSRPGGMIVRVHSLKDNRVWEGAAGAFDGATEVPIKPTDPFRTASIAKSFAAGVVWRLIEEHKLGLDDLMVQSTKWMHRVPPRPWHRSIRSSMVPKVGASLRASRSLPTRPREK